MVLVKRAGGQVARRIRRLQPLPQIPEHRRLPTSDFNAPLYTFKAFAIATTIVFATASASVAGVMIYLDVHDTTEFSARMRTWVSHTMPGLTAKIYGRPPTFDHDAAQQRLADAFDKGGFDAWAETAAKELEASQG